ncbi:MAG: hypothetical protein ACI9MR_002100 [Myxococcota bacterium]|jgi:hypothetical protein
MWNVSARLSRRTALRALGAVVVVVLPALDRMVPSVFAGQAAKAAPALSAHTRVAYIFFPNGCPRQLWEPAVFAPDGAITELGPVMRPLAGFREELTVVGNVWTPKGMGHINGTATWLTGRHYKQTSSGAGGVSADQLLAGLFAPSYRVPSLELSLEPVPTGAELPARFNISWRGNAVAAPRTFEPRAVFDRLFRPSTGPTPQGSPVPQVMDAVKDDARAVVEASGADDRVRLERYFDKIHALEKRIVAAETESRAGFTAGSDTDTGRRAMAGVPIHHETHLRLMLDLMALAFEADITRVSSLLLGAGRSERYLPFLPNVAGHWHALSHYGHIAGDTKWDDGTNRWATKHDKLAMFEQVLTWHMAQVAYFLEQLRAVKEPNGNTLLDNTIVLCGSAVGDGHWHRRTDLPTLVAGGGGGTIPGGRFIRPSSRVDLSSLHTSILQRMGLPIPAFGTSDGPLDALSG